MAIKNPAVEIEDIGRRLESAKRSGLPLAEDELKEMEDDLNTAKVVTVAAEALRRILLSPDNREIQPAQIARRSEELLDQARALAADRRAEGRAQLSREAGELVELCALGEFAPPIDLSNLVSLLLCGNEHNWSRSEHLSIAWARAAVAEAKSANGPNGEIFTASTRSVARYAFKRKGDHRKTIELWRADPDYIQQVRTMRMILAAASS
jgi:hypothetical protein